MICELNAIIEVFRRRFSHESGWLVRINWPREARGALTSDLPEFLKEAQPDWLVKGPTAMGGVVSFKDTTEHGVMLPSSQITSKIVPRGWTGEMALNINGKPLILQNFYLPFERSAQIITLQACKDESVITELFTAAIRWRESKRDKAGTITVFEPHNMLHKARPRFKWEDLILPGTLAQEIQTNIEGFFKSGSCYKDLGVPYKRGFLLAGPPGNGKTFTAKILASDRSVNFVWLKLTDKTDDDMVSQAFNYAYHRSPCILLMEDLDRIAHNGGVTMSNILNQLDGLASGEGILVLATSNAPEKLDPALIHRPSRFDRVWRLGLPGEKERLALLRRKGARFFTEEAMANAASQSGGFSMAYTQEILTNAMILAANDGKTPSDSYLAKSLAQIKGQYKNTWAREGLGREAETGPLLGFAAVAETA